jgi:hypothetical protein
VAGGATVIPAHTASKCQGEHGQRGEAVPADPLAQLVLVEADLALAGLEAPSTIHRTPATRTRTASGTGRGDQQR